MYNRRLVHLPVIVFLRIWDILGWYNCQCCSWDLQLVRNFHPRVVPGDGTVCNTVGYIYQNWLCLNRKGVVLFYYMNGIDHDTR